MDILWLSVGCDDAVCVSEWWLADVLYNVWSLFYTQIFGDLIVSSTNDMHVSWAFWLHVILSQHRDKDIWLFVNQGGCLVDWCTFYWNAS